MIFDGLKNIQNYFKISPLLKRGLILIAGIRPDIRPGTRELAGGLKLIVSSYDTKMQDDGIFESHRRFIDIQRVVIGKERIRWAPAANLRLLKGYDRKKDITLYKSRPLAVSVLMEKNFFAVFFPGDAHKPGLAAGVKAKTVKKAVLKVPVPKD